MANEYKVKVGVDFSAHMNQVDSAVDALGKKLKGLGSLTGNKELFGSLKEEFEGITAELNKLRDVEITPKNADQFSAKVLELGQRLDALNQKTNQVSVDVFDEKLGGAAQKIDETNTKIDSLKNEIQELSSIKSPTEAEKQRLESLNVELEKTEKTLKGQEAYRTRLQNASRDLGITEDQLREALELLAVAHGKVADASERQYEGQQKLTNSKVAKTIENQVTRYIGLNAVYQYSKKYIQDLVKTYKEFDESLVAIAAVTGQTRDEMWANIGVYNKMAQSLGTTTQEVINASKLYYQQGLTTTSVLKLTEETVKLATIAELDSADATEYLTTAMNGFKLSAEESTRVTDVWANLAAKTASDVDELAVAISKVASLAENAGMEIETASAFLNQMIETTREAPENLGTALKTIIARFQELKVSEEALSDGVDANKVERALKSAGVALRGLDGQFRDFDDVILDLSSKWDTLDRNTQRYIATIAAGSRQQSRFIAMVSDYEGLLRNVNYAYDSLGSADAQMAVFQEGLAASTNRLKAAWEGLYTSWSESATVISKLIDAAASFVSTLADLGAGTSALITGFGLFGVSILANAAALNIAKIKTLEAGKSFKYYTKEALKATTSNLAVAASAAAAAAPYVVIAAILGSLIFLYIKLKNSQNDYIKSLEKEATLAKQEGAQAKDRASNIDVLLTELDNAKNSEEDLLEVRQKIIDQFGEEIEAVNDTSLSYEELIGVLREYQKKQEGIAAKRYIDNSLIEDSIDNIPKTLEERVDFADLARSVGGKFTDFRIGNFSILTSYELDGKYYTSYEEYVRAIKEKAGIINEFSISTPVKSVITKAIIDSGQIKKETELSENIIKTFLNSLDRDSLKNLFDEEGILDPAIGKTISDINDEINNLYNTLDAKGKSEFTSLLSGSFENLNFNKIDDLINQLPEKIQTSLNEQKEKIQTELTNFFNTLFIEKDITSVGIQLLQDKLSVGAQLAFKNAFNSLADDPMAQKAFQQSVFELIGSGIDPELITGAMIEALSGAESAEEAFKNLLDVQGELKDPQLLGFFNTLRSIMDDNNETFQEGMAVVDSYYDSMTNLSNLMKGDMNDEDFLSNLRAEAALLAEINGLTEAEVEAMLLRATIRNEEGNLIIKETAELANLANATYIASATTVEGKKAELEAYAAGLQATANYLYGVAAQVKAQEEAGHANSIATQTIINDAATSTEAMNSFGEAAQQAWTAAQGAKEFPAYNKITANLNSYTERLKDCTTSTQILQLANEAASKAITIRGQAAQLSINKLANSFNKAGKSAGGAAKETDKLKDALKDLQDQLKDTKDDAEHAIDAVTDYLEEQKKAAEDAIKAAEDALEKERNILKIQLEAYKEYLEQRQKENQDALELQAQAAAEYFKTEIEGIQVKIDALNDEAEAEDRILKLQKARDEYNRAQNSRTRLVLTKGAGWIFKSDQKKITDARKTLNDVQREIQKAAYQDQIDELQKQADEWERIAENITKTAEEIARLTEAVEKFRQGMTDGGTGYADVDAFKDATEAQTVENGNIARILEKIEKWLEQVDWEYQDYLDDQMRQGFTEEFAKGLVGEKDLEEKVSGYLKNLLSTQQFIEEQQKIIANIENVQAFYELQKSQLELTKAQLEEAKKMRAAIEKAYDPTSENLGLGENSKYYNANILNLIESVHALVEQIAVMEAKQAAQGSDGGNSGSGGNGNSSDGSGSNSDSNNGGWSGRGNSSGGSQLPGQEESNGPCNHDWVKDHSNGHFTYYRCRKCGTMISVPYGVNPSGTGYENPFGTPGFGGYGGVGGESGKLPIISPIGSQNGIGLPSMSTLSTSTPSFNKVTNTSSTTTINIGTLESSANDYNGFVNDLMRNSMIKQPI